MRRRIQIVLGCAAFASVLFAAPFSGAQQKQTSAAQANSSYDLNRETELQGTVVSFTASSQVPPVGSHVIVQTASGPVDVHLGDATVLKRNDMFLVAGDSVRIVGEDQQYGGGSFFAARVLQKGNQSVTLRNSKGIPLSSKRAVTAPNARLRQGSAQ